MHHQNGLFIHFSFSMCLISIHDRNSDPYFMTQLRPPFPVSSIRIPDQKDTDTSLSQEQLEALFYGAVREGRVDMIEAFLDSGMDPNRPDARGFPPLILATYNGQIEAGALLLRRGAAVNAADANGDTALSGVAFKGDEGAARMLLEAGATVDHRNAAGRTPLMFAVMFGREMMVRLLMAHGADPDLTDTEGTSARGIAKAQGGQAMLAALERRDS
ncbi:Ankyrin [Granulibacter bethesdensis]|nr:Ankyrin [Granulibacter bethesdensis]